VALSGCCTLRRRRLPNIKTVAILPFDNQTPEPR